MLEDLEVEVPRSFDPFADAQEFKGGSKLEYVHIRIQQRNGKKSVTTVQGLKIDESSFNKTLKTMKKDLCCNGNVVHDKELGIIIQLQGDQRQKVSQYLLSAGLVIEDHVKIHGF